MNCALLYRTKYLGLLRAAVVLFQCNARLCKKLQRKIIGIPSLVYYARYAAVDYHFGANRARLMRAVQCCAVYANAHFCRLDYGVLFGMRGITKLVPRARLYAQFATHTHAFFLAAFDPRARAVVARSHYPFVFGNHRADLAVFLKTARPARDCVRYFHEPSIPLIHSNSRFVKFVYHYITNIGIMQPVLKIRMEFFD